MEKEYNVVVLDNIEYTEINRIERNNNTYVLLSNLENPAQFCIRKVINENGTDYIVELDNEAEFNEILTLFTDNLKN